MSVRKDNRPVWEKGKKVVIMQRVIVCLGTCLHLGTRRLQSPHNPRLNRLISRVPPLDSNLRNTVKMKHLAAYLLLGLGGNDSPSAKDIKDVLGAVGIEADSERLDSLLSELKGKDINELIASGSEKLASVPSGGGGGAAAAGGAAAGGAADAPAEAAKEEEKEESDEDMGFGLFD
ncbi:hypothetical protein XA68_16369 [Ophiocordyceps unilateralis]|uniref:60S acidic ribosomal protein P2 n=1 Tax=Ophiocordyceps unilateralis TaxID=268505 RepID=A0A2A9PK64_OPHUN|nr:hypothetical protein XA68_16369 [Ophiocordyceps unilateralis]